MAFYQSSKATITGPDSRKQGINRRLREDLSPVRSPRRDRSVSPTSSSSSREAYYGKRGRPRSPGEASEGYKRRRYDEHYGGFHRRSERRNSRGNHMSHRLHDQRARMSHHHDDNNAKTSFSRYTSIDQNGSRSHQESCSPPYHRDDRSSSGSITARIGYGGNDVLSQKDSAFVERSKIPHKQYSSEAPASPKKFEPLTPGMDHKARARGCHFQEADLSANSAEHDGIDQNSAPFQPPKVEGRKSSAEMNARRLLAAPMSEAETSIEERRKRREALRAKLKAQPTDLRVQALQQNVLQSSQVDTPKTPPDSLCKISTCVIVDTANTLIATSPKRSPHTPGENGSPCSLAELELHNDTELTNMNITTAAPGELDEPSAADYDPTIDMREDRLLQDQRMEESEVPGKVTITENVVEHANNIIDMTMNKPKVQEPESKKPAGDDMFASDDDDDMFAHEQPKRVQSSEQKKHNVSKAKEIDTSMLENWDDPQGYYRPILGEILDSRYQIQTNLGKGMFSGVVRAIDQKMDKMKAIKINRANDEMVKTAQKEMSILQRLAEADPDDKKHLVRFERSFNHRGHLCLVFENLSMNLREILKKFGRDVGVNMKAIRTWAKQMFLALSLMRRCNIVHADLKPDNILVNEARSSLKVCDLGSATEPGDCQHADLLVSRFYRAPEIILGYPYDFNTDLWTLGYSIDMWSIGCTLFELFTGKILFTGRDNNQMLRSMMETRGKFSVKMLKKSKDALEYFDEMSLSFRSLERDKVTGRDVVKLINFQQPTRPLKERLQTAASRDAKGDMKESEKKELMLFTDLLDKCLALNPERRITPADALKHPFIQQSNVPFLSK